GVAVLPRYFVSDLLASRRLTALLPDTPLPQDWFRLVWRNGHPQGPHLRTLATELAARPLT
ncbi:MAG: LysR substrate-binding domain-containing protein, partial [Gammaproteobacteria bacterium]